MAIYRQVHISFWEDTKVTDDFTAEDKYFMLYLLTNTKTNLLGCYEISAKQIAFDMGYSEDSIKNLIHRFEKIHEIIIYNQENKEVLVKNWSKYNWNKSPKLEKALIAGLVGIKTESFREFLEAKINGDDDIPYGYRMDTVSKEETKKIYPIDTTVTVSVTDTVSDTVTDNKYTEDKLDPVYSFDAFWKEYPRKESKAKAQQWFIKNKPSAQLFSKMMSSLERFKKTKQWQDKQYIPHPTTWLNQKRWEDEIEVLSPENDLERRVNAVKEMMDHDS